MTVWATADDVADRWRTLTPEEDQRALVLISDLTAEIRMRWPDIDARIASGEVKQTDVTRVVANIVKRGMLASGSEGIRTETQTSGPFSRSVTFANPNGDLYMLASELLVFEPFGYKPTAMVGWLA